MQEDDIESKRGRGRPVNEARREEIISTAARLFGELGLHATTMEQIAKELKMSKLTLYSRFKDKEEIFSAVIKANCEGHIPEQFFGDLDCDAFEQSLYHIALALMVLLTSDGPMNMERMLIGVEAKDRKNLTPLYYEAGPERVKAVIAEYLERLHADKKLHVPNPVFSANLFAGMIKGSDICMRALLDVPPKSTQKEMEGYCHDAVKMFIAAHATKING
jgi:TetR/AcrR family transcriptional regulator, mexJK operon transcriptional repressor